MNSVNFIPPDVPTPLRFYARGGSYYVSGEVVELLAKANHESEANAIFLAKAPFIPVGDRCHVWRKCR